MVGSFGHPDDYHTPKGLMYLRNRTNGIVWDFMVGADKGVLHLRASWLDLYTTNAEWFTFYYTQGSIVGSFTMLNFHELSLLPLSLLSTLCGFLHFLRHGRFAFGSDTKFWEPPSLLENGTSSIYLPS